MSEVVGTVKELWRYPVKSMVGEMVESAEIEHLGMFGDRYWAVRDENAGEITVVRKTPKLLGCAARYVAPLAGDKVPPVAITFPDGEELTSGSSEINEKLSTLLGKPVSLWPLQPKSNWRHYRLGGVVGAKEMKRLFASKELPDLSSISWKLLGELMFFATPLGRYYDVFPLHILSTGALRKIAEIEPGGEFVPQRFRPNIVVESNEGVVDFDDFAWGGGRLSVGETIIQCETRTVRCSMPAQPQMGRAKDSKVLRAVDTHMDRYFGINATVIQKGTVQVGDEVRWQAVERSSLARAMRRVSGRAKNAFVHGSLKAADLLAGK